MLAIFFSLYYNTRVNAGVMELVDVADSKSAAGDSVPVRARSPAPIKPLLSFDKRGFLYGILLIQGELFADIVDGVQDFLSGALEVPGGHGDALGDALHLLLA